MQKQTLKAAAGNRRKKFGSKTEIWPQWNPLNGEFLSENVLLESRRDLLIWSRNRALKNYAFYLQHAINVAEVFANHLFLFPAAATVNLPIIHLISSAEKFTMVGMKFSLIMMERICFQSVVLSPKSRQIDSNASFTAAGGLAIERTSTRCCFFIDLTARKKQAQSARREKIVIWEKTVKSKMISKSWGSVWKILKLQQKSTLI